MEKASTPRNRLTRSAAKQVNTPTKKVEKDDNLDQTLSEDLKHKLRKSRRKSEAKPKTNGDTSTTAVERKKMKAIEERNYLDGCESEGSDISVTQKNSPKANSDKITSPSIQKKSLRTRRSITPGPDLESSAPKRMRRSISEGKLENLSTPTRRSTRANSESKDFVFTPTKTNSAEHRNAMFRVIDKIVEASESEESSLDVDPITSKKENNSVEVNNETGITSLDSEAKPNDILKPTVSVRVEPETAETIETDYKTDIECSKIQQSGDNEQEICQNSSSLIVIEEDLEESPQELNNQQSKLPSEKTVPPLSCEKHNVDGKYKETSCKEITVTGSENITDVCETDKSCTSAQYRSQNDSKVTNINELSQESDKSVSGCFELQEPHQTLSTEDKHQATIPHNLEDAHPIVQSETIAVNDNNNLRQLEIRPENQNNELPIKTSTDTECVVMDNLFVSESESNEPLTISEPEEKEAVSKSASSPLVVKGKDKLQTEDKTDETISPVEFSEVLVEALKICGEGLKGANSVEDTNVTEEINDTGDNNENDNAEDVVCEEVTEALNTDKKDIDEAVVCELSENDGDRAIVYEENGETLDQNVKDTDEAVVYETSENYDNGDIVYEENSEALDRNEKDTDEAVFKSNENDQGDDTKDSQTLTIENYNVKSVLYCEPGNTESMEVKEVRHSLDQNEKDNIDSVIICESDNSEPRDETEETQLKILSVKTLATTKQNNIETEEINNLEKNDEKDVYSTENDSTVINSEQCNLNFEEEVLIEDSDESPVNEIKMTETVYLDKKSKEEFYSTEVEDPLEMGQTRSKLFIEESSQLELLDENESDECAQNIDDDKESQQEKVNKNDSKLNELQSQEFYEHDYEGIMSNRIEEDSASDCDIYKGLSDFGTDKDEKKNDSHFEGSVSTDARSGASDSDLSSFEDDEEEEKEGEEDEKEGDEDEKEGEEEHVDQENMPSNNQNNKQESKDQKTNQSTVNVKEGEKLFDTSSPMTYDKALAILNKNRVRKIDDEEFFDMFTQELNRVSEPSGSDSDIAIVDEYILDEEPVKKPSQKPAVVKQASFKQVNVSSANGKQAQRVTMSKIVMSNKPGPPEEHFTGTYSQQLQTHHAHPHPAMQRMNFPQGGMYHQYNQGMPPPVNPMRHVMYDQYGNCQPPPTSMSDPRLFNPHIQHDAHFVGAGMYNTPIPDSDSHLHYSGAPAIKVRSISQMNEPQPYDANNPNYMDPELVSTVDYNVPGDPNENVEDANFSVNAATMTEKNEKLDQAAAHSSASRDIGETSTHILKLLGLDKVKLKLLKKALGITTSVKSNKSKQNSQSRLDNKSKKSTIKKKENLKPKARKRCLKKISSPYQTKTCKTGDLVIKKRHRVGRQKKKALIKHILDSDSTLSPNKFDASSSSEHSSKESIVSSDDYFPGIYRSETDSLSEATVEYENRKINIDGTNVLITFNTGPRNEPGNRVTNRFTKSTGNSHFTEVRKKRKRNKSKQEDVSSSESVEPACRHTINKTTNKRANARKKPKKDINEYAQYSSLEDVETEFIPGKKMTQVKKVNKKTPAVLWSNSGTFTVESQTAESISESDMAPLNMESEMSTKYLEELKRNMKSDLSSGYNKLSNLFSQRSFERGTKKKGKGTHGVKKDRSKKEKLKENKLKKLSVEILQQLAKEGEKKKQLPVSGSEGKVLKEKSKKSKKKRLRVKVKSAVAEDNYIPLVTATATQFNLSRLDKQNMSAIAQSASTFRTNQLYGPNVKRVTSQELLNVKKKQKINEAAAAAAAKKKKTVQKAKK